MSGWWHPEGPESVATYWSRRLVVIAAAVVVLVLAIVLVTTGAQGTEPTGTPTPAVAPASTPSSAPAPSGSSASEPSPSASASSASPTSASPTPAASQSADATPSSSAGGTSSKKTTDKSSGTATPATPACDPSRLRATLQGDPSPEAGTRVVFTLSLINGGDEACRFARTADTVELKVYSGTDRIWSTADCPTLVRRVAEVVKPQGTVTWKMAWSGRRSAEGCHTRTEIPRPGTYFATFQFTGAKPVQQRMVLTAS